MLVWGTGKADGGFGNSTWWLARWLVWNVGAVDGRDQSGSLVME